MLSFRALAPLFPQVIDCRKITCEIRFSLLSKLQIDKVAMDYYTWCIDFMGENFVEDWFFCGKPLKKGMLAEKLQSKRAYTIGFDADVISNVIYNKRTLRKHEQKCSISVETLESCCLNVSVDYMKFLSELLKNNPSNETEWKVLLHKLFYEKRRRFLNVYRGHDAGGMLTCLPYEANPSLYHGSAVFSICVACARDCIQDVANMMCDFLVAQANQCGVSGVVTVTSAPQMFYSCAHMEYFGENPKTDDSHIVAGYDPDEWYPYYYVLGAEWFNVISPLQRNKLPNLLNEAANRSEIYTELLPSGGVVVRLLKDIIQTDVDDYLIVKELLYNALYPGEKVFYLEHLLDAETYGYMPKPRGHWELVPLLDDEIHVFFDRIEFRHLTKA